MRTKLEPTPSLGWWSGPMIMMHVVMYYSDVVGVLVDTGYMCHI